MRGLVGWFSAGGFVLVVQIRGRFCLFVWKRFGYWLFACVLVCLLFFRPAEVLGVFCRRVRGVSGGLEGVLELKVSFSRSSLVCCPLFLLPCSESIFRK